ncbi:MAG: hypothetical protein ABI843_04225 [Dokdonella sp.]
MALIWDINGTLVEAGDIVSVSPPANNAVRVILRGGATVDLRTDGRVKTEELHARIVAALARLNNVEKI